MQTPSVSATPPLGVDGNLFGPTGIDTSLYAQLLLVKDYDDQLKDSANQIKISNKLKEAYRLQKKNVQELFTKEKDKDGKVSLNKQELALLESEPTYAWDRSKNEGQGGITTYYKNDPVVTQNAGYQAVDYNSKEAPVSANKQARIWGDPHVEDPNGGHWDFQGVAGETYRYLKDANIEINATHKAAGGNTKVISDLQILAQTKEGPFNILAHPDGFTLNEKTLMPGTFQKMGDDGYVSVDGHRLIVSTPEYTSIVDQVNGQYLDLTIDTKSQGVFSDGRVPDGVAGNRFNSNAPGIPPAEEALRREYRVSGFTPVDDNTVKVDKDKIQGEMERIDMELENLNGNGELMSLTLQSLTNQRKTAFETVSNILSKSTEAANNIARNIAR